MSDDTTPDLLALVRTGDWLDAQDFPPLRWAVYGLIPQGFGLFTGPPKAGKSWAALGFALAVADGSPALGKIDTGTPRPVLYLALEDGDARLQWRARTLLGEGAPIPPLMHTVTQMPPGLVLDVIAAWLDVHGRRAPLVLLDTLGRVMPPSLMGESAYQRDYRIGARLKALCDAHPGSTLLVVHHVRKAHGEDWMDSTSGTNGLNGAADFTLNLSRARNEESGVLRVTGRDVPESEYAVTTRGGSWTIDGETLAEAASAAATARAVADLGDTSSRVVEYVARNPEGVRAAQVAEACDITEPTARTYLGRLVDSGRLSKMGRGVYSIPSTPAASVMSVANEGPNDTHATHVTGVGRDDDLPCPDCGRRLSRTELPEGVCIQCRRIRAAEAAS